MRYAYAVLLLILLCAIMLFAIENSAAVEVRMLAWRTRLPVASIAVGSYVLGMVSGTALWAFIQTALRKVKEIRAVERR